MLRRAALAQPRAAFLRHGMLRAVVSDVLVCALAVMLALSPALRSPVILLTLANALAETTCLLCVAGVEQPCGRCSS